MPSPDEIEALLDRVRSGDGDARAELFEAVYEQLHRIAGNLFRASGRHATLQTTVLVHEAYLKMGGKDSWESRSHFLSVAAKAMRHVLADHVRSQRSLKRPDPDRRITLVEELDGETPELDFEELHVALERLNEADPRASQVVELRIFAGLSVEDVAALLEVSVRSVHRDWRAARAWLRQELET